MKLSQSQDVEVLLKTATLMGFKVIYYTDWVEVLRPFGGASDGLFIPNYLSSTNLDALREYIRNHSCLGI